MTEITRVAAPRDISVVPRVAEDRSLPQDRPDRRNIRQIPRIIPNVPKLARRRPGDIARPIYSGRGLARA